MKSPDFNYARPKTMDEAVTLLAENEDALILAGGQSLVAALNLRLQAPDLVIDINYLPGLDGIEIRDGMVCIGALVRHADLLAHPDTTRTLPLIAQALPHVAHPAIRNRGTICGSIAYADPAAEMPACAVALGAIIVLASARGTREVSARNFFGGLYETERAQDEILVEVRLPVAAHGVRVLFDEVAVRRGDFATIGLAGQIHLEDGIITTCDLVAFGSEPRPLLMSDVSKSAIGNVLTAELVGQLSKVIADTVDPMGSPLATPEMRRRQYRGLAKRAFLRVMETTDA